MGQTVNLLAYAFGGSNPSLPTQKEDVYKRQDLYEGIYDESSYTWKQGEGPARYVEFETSAASTIARIEVTYE